MSMEALGGDARSGVPTNTLPTTNPVTLEILRGLFKSAAEEMGLNLIRTAYSHSIKERRDIATAVFDASGRMVAQAEHIPLLLTGLYPIAKSVAARPLQPGDVLIANDPWNGGGSHLPDVALARPIFAGEGLLGFVACIAHHADVGGAVPGSTSIEFNEIFMEGLRLPPMRLVRAGQIDDDVMQLITANCRLPDERRRDLEAQIGALDLGVRRLTEMADHYGRETVAAVMATLIDRSTERMVKRIAEVPTGDYEAFDALDHDSDEHPARLAVKVSVKDDRIVVDFGGTSPQLPRAANMVLNATEGAVFFALVSLLAPFEETTYGTFLPIEIRAPAGSIVNASAPAAVSGRAQTCPRVVDLIFMALAPALPGEVIANSNVGPAIKISGHHPDTGHPFIISEVLGGGGGARSNRDGLDGSQMYITNTTNMPIEFLESEYPVLVESLRLAPSSGGDGRFRGGLGIAKAFLIDIDEGGTAECGCIVDRHLTPPKGLHGGHDGRGGELSVRRANGQREVVHPSRARIWLGKGDVVELTTSGGGGYGNADERDPLARLLDLDQGLVLPSADR